MKTYQILFLSLILALVATDVIVLLIVEMTRTINISLGVMGSLLIIAFPLAFKTFKQINQN